MAVVVTGLTLTLDDVVRVARGGEEVEIAADALERMRERRAVVEEAAITGAAVYGVTTGVGMRREAAVGEDDAAAFNR